MNKKRCEAQVILGQINIGAIKPDKDIIQFEDGSELKHDKFGIGWYLSCDAGGVPVREDVNTPQGIRREPRHRQPRMK